MMLPAPPPDRANSTVRPDLHPDDHNALADRIADLHQLFPEPIDWGAVWDVPGATIPAEFTDVSGRLVRVPCGVPVDPDRIQPAPVWLLGESYSTGDYVYGVDGVLYQATSNHTSTADDEPGVGTAWETRWQLPRVVEWYVLEVVWTFETSAATGSRQIVLDPAAASELEPLVYSRWGVEAGGGFNLNQYAWSRGFVLSANGRLTIDADGHQAGQGPYPNAARGLVPFYRKVTP